MSITFIHSVISYCTFQFFLNIKLCFNSLKWTNRFVQVVRDVEVFPSFVEVWAVDDDMFVFDRVVCIACWE